MGVQGPSNHIPMLLVLSQMPRIVAMTVDSNNLCCFSVVDICLLMAGEHEQPGATHALWLSQTCSLGASGA